MANIFQLAEEVARVVQMIVPGRKIKLADRTAVDSYQYVLPIRMAYFLSNILYTHVLGLCIPKTTSEKWNISRHTTTERYITISHHATENTVANTNNATYAWRRMGRLGQNFMLAHISIYG